MLYWKIVNHQSAAAQRKNKPNLEEIEHAFEEKVADFMY